MGPDDARIMQRLETLHRIGFISRETVTQLTPVSRLTLWERLKRRIREMISGG